MNNMKQNNKGGKKPSSDEYIGISVGMGLVIGTTLGVVIPAIGIALGAGIGLIFGAGIGAYLQEKHGHKLK